MTPERAKDIQYKASQWPDWGATKKFMTPAEIAEVQAVWDGMRGNTCFNDALNRFSHPRLFPDAIKGKD